MPKPFRTLDDADVSGKRVLLRVDLNVPTEGGKVTDTTRIERVAEFFHVPLRAHQAQFKHGRSGLQRLCCSSQCSR